MQQVLRNAEAVQRKAAEVLGDRAYAGPPPTAQRALSPENTPEAP